MTISNQIDVKAFRHSAPYINAHRGKTFVIMLPGKSIDSENFPNIISDIALLQSLGIRLVVVHGARKQIDQQVLNNGFATEKIGGMRITPREQLSAVLAAVGSVRLILESAFSTGLPSTPLYGAKIQIRGGNFITAMPLGVIDGVDFQLTGKTRSVDSPGISTILDSGAIALISPLGYSSTGEIFNLGFDDVGVQVALTLDADKLIVYNDDGSVRDETGEEYRELTLLKCEKFLVKHPVKSGNHTYFSLKTCHKACDGGIARAHIVSSNEDGALLRELFTRDGSGTMVYRDSYEAIRRARIDDVPGILSLIEPLETEGVLVKRSRELLECEIGCFTVMEKDNVIIGCAALYPLSEGSAGELACVAVHPDYRRHGRARQLLNHLERQSLKLGVRRLFVLTTQTAHWFLERGFVEAAPTSLPVERKALYNFQRNSKVFIKELED